jgi:hypothetical protein
MLANDLRQVAFSMKLIPPYGGVAVWPVFLHGIAHEYHAFAFKFSRFRHPARHAVGLAATSLFEVRYSLLHPSLRLRVPSAVEIHSEHPAAEDAEDVGEKNNPFFAFSPRLRGSARAISLRTFAQGPRMSTDCGTEQNRGVWTCKLLFPILFILFIHVQTLCLATNDAL